MSQPILVKSITEQTAGRGQTTEQQAQIVNSNKRIGPQRQTTTAIPGQQTVTRTQEAFTSTSTQTTPETITTSTTTKPETIQTQKTYGHIGVRFQFTVQVLSISPVDPAEGSGLSC